MAPTQKISDDASFPQRPVTSAAGHHGRAVAPPSAAPRLVLPPGASGPPVAPSSAPPPSRAISSAPPRVYAAPLPASRPPDGSAKQLQPRPRRPPLDEPSMPIVARRPWGLIIVVLLIDLGLVTAGGWMLREGLGDPVAPYDTSAPVPDRRPPGSR